MWLTSEYFPDIKSLQELLDKEVLFFGVIKKLTR